VIQAQVKIALGLTAAVPRNAGRPLPMPSAPHQTRSWPLTLDG